MVDKRSLEGFRRIHMVGAGGSGMSGLAKLLAGRGYDVTGSDLKPNRVLDALEDIGIETWVGHRPERMNEPQLVVASSAVPQQGSRVASRRRKRGGGLGAARVCWMRSRPKCRASASAAHTARRRLRG